MVELLEHPGVVTALIFLGVLICLLVSVIVASVIPSKSVEGSSWRDVQSGGNLNLDFYNEIKSNEFICPHCLDVMGTWPEIREHIRAEHKDEIQWKSE